MNSVKGVFYQLYDKNTGKMYNVRDDMIYNKRVNLSLRYMWISYARLNGCEYVVIQVKAYQVESIPGALRQKMDADDLEGNPVLVLMRLKE